MPIDPLPPHPVPTMPPSVFQKVAHDFLGGLPLFAAQANELEQNVNAKEAGVIAANLAAQAAKTAAQTAQASAEAVMGATLWSADTQYAPPQCAAGSDGHTYRAVEPVTGVDPVGDTSGKWTRISAGGSTVSAFADFTARPGGNYLLMPGVVMTLPPNPVPYDLVTFRAAGQPWPLVARAAGVKIKGVDSDHRINGYAVQELVYRDGGWV